MAPKNNYINKKVNVQLAITKEETLSNIKANLNQIPNWYGDLFYPNGFEAIIVSGGPSLEKYVAELNIKERMEKPDRSFVVFCVKHALPRLMKMGIEPDFCVILDGRDFNAESTHGVKRKDLFEAIPERTVFLVASMSHPGYASYLMTHGARVLGWHTAVAGLEEFQQQGIIREPVISGGTSSGTRCIGIANAMGIRDITLVSFDSCILNPTPAQLEERDKKGRIKYMPVDLPILNPPVTPEQRIVIDNLEKQYKEQGYVFMANLAKRFYTTGELLAQSQDFEGIFTNASFDFQLKVFDDGLVSHMFKNMVGIPKRNYSFVEYFKTIVPKKDIAKYPKRKIVLGSKRQKRAKKVEQVSVKGV